MGLLKQNYVAAAVVLVLIALGGLLAYDLTMGARSPHRPSVTQPTLQGTNVQNFRGRVAGDSSDILFIIEGVKRWSPNASLAEIATAWKEPGKDSIREIERMLAAGPPAEEAVRLQTRQAFCWIFEGHPEQALELLASIRSRLKADPELAATTLYPVIYMQGIASLRLGETANCVMCRGESSCILPLSPTARHTDQTGSRDAVKHFTEYLEQFPDDLEVKWLLNIAHMTLGEHPDRVDPRFLVSLERYNSNEHGIGKFRDVGHLLGINRLNMAGGSILDDFDNDGLLDLVFTTLDPGQHAALYRNQGDGTFEDRSEQAGLLDQWGGLNCVQADYNNDGWLDIYVPRGAWLTTPMRPSLLKNTGEGKFVDVTREAGLLHPMNSDNAQFADFDNDSWLDLFVCGESQPSRLYRNLGDGTFEDVTQKAGLAELPGVWKGLSWFDYDNDAYPDIFLNCYNGPPRLLHNNQNGSFSDVASDMGIDGPVIGLACWTWDYDNDGWLDIFATSYDRSLEDSVKGLLGQPHKRKPSRLYRNVGGERFEDVTRQMGLTECYSTMGCNFADFDNDGYLDCYLGTGDHDVAALMPNRMLRNLGGSRFVDITSSSGTGHLQKGHGVGCGDWDRDGDVDLAIEMGGAMPGDRYHNIMFLNPGQANHWLNVKLVGTKSNRSAIGARIKVVTAGDKPLSVYRCVSSGSSFGANPLEQFIGLGSHEKIDVLEVFWPTSGTTQVVRDVPIDQCLEITELADEFRQLQHKAIELPTASS